MTNTAPFYTDRLRRPLPERPQRCVACKSFTVPCPGANPAITARGASFVQHVLVRYGRGAWSHAVEVYRTPKGTFLAVLRRDPKKVASSRTLERAVASLSKKLMAKPFNLGAAKATAEAVSP